jgi:hypothetical protein
MKYNVLTRVVSIVEADSPAEARTKAEDQITRLLGDPDENLAEVYREKDRPGDVQEVD